MDIVEFCPSWKCGSTTSLKTSNNCFVQEVIGALHSDFCSLSFDVCLVTIGQSFCLMHRGSKARS